MSTQLIDKYQLQPHPEGGHYREIYTSSQQVMSPIHQQPRAAVTQIYFLLQLGEVSRFHRVLHDEIWHHYEGAALTLYQFDGKNVTQTQIGGHTGNFTCVVPGGVYQAAESTGDYSLVGCTVAPGFNFDDFAFITEPSLQRTLTAIDTGYQRLI